MEFDIENGVENGIESNTQPKLSDRKRYLKIFSILVLCEQLPSLRDFIEAEITDSDLPLVPCDNGLSLIHI